MRLPALIASLILTVATALPGVAETFDSPKALLTALYAPYFQEDGDTTDTTPYFSDRLNALYAKDAASTPDGEMGALDFDPVAVGQDYAITKLEIDAPTIHGDTADVTVRFDNFDMPQVLYYSIVKEHGGWKVDDIENKQGDSSWDLVKILTDGGRT